VTSLAIMARSRSRDQRPAKIPANRQFIAVSPHPRNQRQGLLRIGSFTMACALGKNGIGILKREGDGKTPLATMEVLFGFYRPGRWPMMSRQPWLFPVGQNQGWCDAPYDRNYNRAVPRPYPASHEKLARDDSLYDCVIVLNWNMNARAQNRGSAIFVHVAKQGYQPTEGCIALSRHDMIQLVSRIKPGTKITTRA
jgi:L,D-peptidoglycan transpeptidase YkuD (ErfK/YbiS/YcfS/YnhG family)